MTTNWLDSDDERSFFLIHRHAEAAGLGTLVRVGGQWEWIPTREGSVTGAGLLADASSRERFAAARLRELITAAYRDGKSIREISAEVGRSFRFVREALA